MDVVEYFVKKGLLVEVKNKVSHLTVVDRKTFISFSLCHNCISWSYHIVHVCYGEFLHFLKGSTFFSF